MPRPRRLSPFPLALILLVPLAAAAQVPPLLPEPEVAALAAEVSGRVAKEAASAIAQHHRMRGSRGFRAAAVAVAERARAYGLENVEVVEFPADGEIFYGTQRSRPAWEAEFGELWEVREAGSGVPVRLRRLASWYAMPVSLAQDSESGRVVADLVDVGSGLSESDYAGKDVRGRLVLASSQPGAVAPLAVGRHAAAGIVSYAQNQRSAWWGEDDRLVRWGHLDTFGAERTFGFMISLGDARGLMTRLAGGERVLLEAEVRAGRRAGTYDVVTAEIAGADPRLRDEEIVFTCHLDHQRPGANDNASGCAAILEAGRTLAKLIAEGRLDRPARTIRFVWPPEIEGTLAILTARPEWAARVRAVVHMDMVGGGPETKAVFHVTRSPATLPTFINDVAEAFARLVNEESYRHASARGPVRYPLVSPEGGREPLQARFQGFTMGSDHQVYTEGSWRIPAIYFNDWPDRYIHTNRDEPANIDPTKLKRAAFLGAASGYFLATMTDAHVPGVRAVVRRARLRREAIDPERVAELAPDEARNYTRFREGFERELEQSIRRFLDESPPAAGAVPPSPRAQVTGPPSSRSVYARNPEVQGPMTAFGYSYLGEFYGADRVARLSLPRHAGLRGSGPEYAYEALNLVDGRRSAAEIRDALSASYGPVPVDAVVEYLVALESIDVIRRVR